jgi:hypothetical protein
MPFVNYCIMALAIVTFIGSLWNGRVLLMWGW